MGRRNNKKSGTRRGRASSSRVRYSERFRGRKTRSSAQYSERVIHRYEHGRPRFTGHAQGNMNVNANAPTTRVGWLLAVIVIIALIFIIPWALSESLPAAVSNGFQNLWTDFVGFGQSVGYTLSQAWTNFLNSIPIHLGG